MLKKLNTKNHIQFVKNISLQVNEEYKYLIPKLKYILGTYETIYQLNKLISISYGVQTREDIYIKPGNVGKIAALKCYKSQQFQNKLHLSKWA
jgi:hypothetical protein|tara:strand:- start:270 stop:548 length:279 start_codon:yes stop_codon:yes gene_type:complete